TNRSRTILFTERLRAKKRIRQHPVDGNGRKAKFQRCERLLVCRSIMLDKGRSRPVQACRWSQRLPEAGEPIAGERGAARSLLGESSRRALQRCRNKRDSHTRKARGRRGNAAAGGRLPIGPAPHFPAR